MDIAKRKNYFREFTGLEEGGIFEFLKTGEHGLKDKEANERRKQYGLNEITEKKTAWIIKLARQFKSSFIYLLLGAALLSFFLKEYFDCLMIVLFVFINVFLSFFQEFKSEKALSLLKKFINVRAKVFRAGKEVYVDSRELVPGDIVIMGAGDIIPADLRIIKENNLFIDEEVLTGESVHVKKSSQALDKNKKEIYEASNIAFSGTKVAEGGGEGVVFATGANTTIGEIAVLSSLKGKVSEFEKGITKLSKFTFIAVGLTLLFILAVNILIKTEGVSVIEMIVFSIALAVSVIPEALPVVISVSLSRGAIKLAKKKVVVRRLSAIEDLGSIEILCTDKTGTITENKLTVADVNANDAGQCLYYAVLASSFINEKEQKESNNAFDIALWEKLSSDYKKNIASLVKISELPFTPERRMNSALIELENQATLIVRGAPEEIIMNCANLNEDEKDKIFKWAKEEGKNGKRSLAVASKILPAGIKNYNEKDEKQLNLIGLISFVDELKKSTVAAIAKAEKLGVKIKIITGDSLEVARSVGLKTGLIKDDSEAISGREFESLNEKQKTKAVSEKNVFARISPQQKFEIIELLEKKYRVGFLGEGINDAPALKAANISIVVESASDISRQTADIVLLQKSLEVIIDGIMEGRKIFSNVVKYIKTTLASNFGNFYAIAISTFFIPYLPMLPLQILLLNLLSDFPMIAIATDNVEPSDIQKPKTYDIKNIIFFCTFIGLVSSVFDFIFFALFSRISPEVLHTNWFIGSILTELALIFSVRTKLPFFKAQHVAPVLLWLSAVAAGATILIPFTRFGREIFKFTPPTLNHLLLILFIVGVYFIITEIVKHTYYRLTNNTEKVK